MDLAGHLCGAVLVALGAVVGGVIGFGFRDHLSVLLSEWFAWGEPK